MMKPFPHGAYGLVVTVLVTAGWVTSLFEDGCNYVRVTGNITADAFGVSTPYVEMGLKAYRLPEYDGVTQVWTDPVRTSCLVYPEAVLLDGYWKASKFFNFIAVVLGGGATFYLLISLFCRFSRSSWMTAGYEVALASLFQCLCFVSLRSEICQSNNCEIDYGAKADVSAAVCWLVACTLIFCHYPKPRQQKDDLEGVMTDDSSTETPTHHSGDDVGMVAGVSSRKEEVLDEEDATKGDLHTVQIT